MAIELETSEAAPEATLANWRQAPYSRWGFRNVRRLVPVAEIPRGEFAACFKPGPALELDRIAVPGQGGSVARLMAESDTDGLLVLHRGAVVAEHYAHGLNPKTQHIVFSISKSIAGLIAGILVDRGQLDPDAPVTAYVPEAAGSAYAGATVRHVLDMTVGIRFVEDYVDPAGDVARYRVAMGWNPPSEVAQGGDLHGFIAALPPDGSRHGETFHYVSPNSDMLGWICERASGMRFGALMSELLWRPMWTEADAYITLDRLGAPRTAGGICMTLRDLARIGELMRRDGRAGGLQVVPQRWVDDILDNGDRQAWARGDLAHLAPQGRYRSQWYVLGPGRDVVCGIGIHGQWIYVDRAAELVIAKMSSQPVAVDDALDHRLLAGFRAIAQAVG
ncbi:beta-lactamase family protein [Inquilinus limosus]|uniref:serine hydrolase domain-containing protein n=1 Tax=Inquilinus limosus TaxID=171674 RepID=UPI003F188491